jgi:hypothetical protein
LLWRNGCEVLWLKEFVIQKAYMIWVVFQSEREPREN